MPPRIPSAASLSSRSGLFFCPSCSLWRLRLGEAASMPSTPRPHHAPRLLLSATRRRHASTLASKTAINPPLEAPPRLKELHHALDALKSDAANYVNLSRLQLALRGLEARDPVVRIAVLSLGDQRAARRLVRLLLADPLGAKGAWEEELEKESGEENGQAILLRYGDDTDTHPRNPLLHTVSAPSRTLQKHNVEILISSLNANMAGPVSPSDAGRPRDAILVPTLQTPTSASGRLTMVTYPVHRAIVFGEGVEACVAYGRFTAAQSEQDMPPATVKIAMGLPAPSSEVDQQTADRYVAVDVDLGSQALDKFRESIANSVFFERGWFRSGMPALTTWLAQETSTEPAEIKPAIRDLIDSVLTDADESITVEDSRRLKELLATSIPETTKTAILGSLAVWAEHAHTELRDQLDMAFAGKHWRKLAWWKLFWRVDDVGMITSEILERRWLTDAEKGIIWVAGRIEEAGFYSGTDAADTPGRASLLEAPCHQSAKLGDVPSAPRASQLKKYDMRTQDDGSVSLPALKPWPQQIPMARAHLSGTTVPPLQALAQKLVLQTLSTASATSALSALLYVSFFPALSAFEAGAAAALGVAWALRRMQRAWEAARRGWEGAVREAGRKALKTTEEGVREFVAERGAPKADEVGAGDRRRAREAVGLARGKLAEMVGGERR